MEPALMKSVAQELLDGSAPDHTLQVRRTARSRLRTARFTMNGREYEAVEQNATKPSRWGQLAREGHKVVQFRDVETGKYVGVAVDGNVRLYGGDH